MNEKIKEYINLHHEIPSIEAQLHLANSRIQDIGEYNKGVVSGTVVLNLLDAKHKRDQIEKDLEKYQSSLETLKNEILRWFEEVPQITGVWIGTQRVDFDHNSKEITIVTAMR